MGRVSKAPNRGCLTSALDWLQFRRPFQEGFLPAKSRWRLMRMLLGLPLTSLSVRLGYLTLGRSPTFWLASKVVLASPGFVVMYLNSCASALGFMVSLCSAGVGLCLGLLSLGLTRGAAMELTLSHSVQYLLGSLIMRVLVDTRCTVENVKSLRFFMVMVVMSALTPSMGASFVVLLFSSNALDSDGLGMAWIEWFVPNVAAIFVTLSLGSVILAYCIRKGAFEDFRRLLRTRRGFLYTVVVFGCVAIIGVVYSLEGLHATRAVPLLLMIMPVLGSLSLVMPQFATAWIDVGLVFAMAYGTRYDRGPLHALLKGSDQLGTTLCVQASLLLSVALTATLRVARQQRTSAFKLQRTDSERKLAFFTHVSHEFRTPLSVVIGYTEDLLEHHQLSPSVRVDMENILYASLGMSAMVEDLLALFRLETHGLVFSSRPIQTKLFFDKVLAVAERLARTKRHHVSIRVDLPPVLVFDPNRMNQMVVNLLSNAVKFTPPGGRIKIDARLASQSEHIGNGSSSSGSSAGDNRDHELSSSDSNHGLGEAAVTTCTGSLANNKGSRDADGKALGGFRPSSGSNVANAGRLLDNDSYNSDVGSKRPSLNTSHNNTDNESTNGEGSDPRSDALTSKRPSFNTIHKKYFNLATCNISNPSKGRRSSFSAVHSSNFGIHNNFKNGLVVDLDGSNGLLARLGRRRGIRVPRSRGISSSGRDSFPTSRGPSPPPPPRPPPLRPAPPRNAGAGGEPFPVDVGKSTHLMVVSVTDSGPGIPPADVSRLFERFFRADTTGVEGTGLGLTICQHIATSLGGRIKICSTVGVGSTFAVTIPVVEVPPPTPPAVVGGMASDPRAAANTGKNTNHYCSESGRRLGLAAEQSDVSLSALVEWTKKEEAEHAMGHNDQEEEEVHADNEERRRQNIEGRGVGSGHAEGMEVRCGREEATDGRLGDGDSESRLLAALEEGRRGGRSNESCPEVSGRAARETEERAEVANAWGRAKGRESADTDEVREGTSAAASNVEAARPSCESLAATTAAVAQSASEIRPPGRTVTDQAVCDFTIKNKNNDNPIAIEQAATDGGGVRDVGGGGDSGGESPFRLKILLAEDSLPNQKLMCRILQRAGHTVEAVGDGQAALDRLVSGEFDMLVLDLGLPKKEGMEVLAELRSMTDTSGAIRDIPVIVSSGHVLDETRRLCLEAGCNAFTEKPFRAKVIVETVQRVMAEHVSGANVAGNYSTARA